MIGPRDPMAAGAAGRGRIRAADADRERVIEALKTSFAAGLMAREEFVTRVGRALESRTYAELVVLLADLRAGPARTPPPPEPLARRPRRPANRAAVAWAACAVIVLPAIGAAFLTFYGGFLVVLLLAFIAVVVTGQPATGDRR